MYIVAASLFIGGRLCLQEMLYVYRAAIYLYTCIGVVHYY